MDVDFDQVDEHDPRQKEQEIFRKSYALVSKKNTPLYQKVAFVIDQLSFGTQEPSENDEHIPPDILRRIHDDVVSSKIGVDLLNSTYPIISSIYDTIEDLRKSLRSYESIMYQLNGFITLIDQYHKDIDIFNKIVNVIKDVDTKTLVINTILDTDVFRVAELEEISGEIVFKKDSNGRVKKNEVDMFLLIKEWSDRAHGYLKYQKSYIESARRTLSKIKGKFLVLENIIKTVEDDYKQRWPFILSYKDVKISEINISNTAEHSSDGDQLIYPDFDQTPIDKGLTERWVAMHLSAYSTEPYYPINKNTL